MEREILFRGKHIDRGEWIYGFLEEEVVIGFITQTGDFDEEFIDPNTIGQYTGLKDRNYVKIFEGDILAEYGEPTFVFIVRYGEYPDNLEGKNAHIGFYCDWVSCHNLKPKCSLLFWADKFKIIGNIYDNPELIPSCQ